MTLSLRSIAGRAFELLYSLGLSRLFASNAEALKPRRWSVVLAPCLTRALCAQHVSAGYDGRERVETRGSEARAESLCFIVSKQELGVIEVG